ncbi:hypothetical protein [Halosimplex sp. J119]
MGLVAPAEARDVVRGASRSGVAVGGVVRFAPTGAQIKTGGVLAVADATTAVIGAATAAMDETGASGDDASTVAGHGAVEYSADSDQPTPRPDGGIIRTSLSCSILTDIGTDHPDTGGRDL